MFEEFRVELTNGQAEAYLKRIKLEKETPSLDYLNRLVQAQLRIIPFDDADVWATGKAPSLATADLFDKIIIRKRGGYCFELNILFCDLLKVLGFDAYNVIIHLGRPGVVFAPPAHCGVVVKLDGQKHFADVGYGGPVPDGTVPFTGEVVRGHKQGMNGVYTVVYSQNTDGTWFPRFTFKDMPCDQVEMVPLNFHVAERPGSVFAADLKLNLRLDNGYAEIGNKIFKYKNGDELIERPVKDEADAKLLAEKYFGIPGGNIPTRPLD